MKYLMKFFLHTGGILAAVFALVTAIVLLVLPVAPAQSATAPDLQLDAGAAKVLPLAPGRIAIDGCILLKDCRHAAQ